MKILLCLCILLLVCSLASAIDRDNDGYEDFASGGTDCVDTYSFVFKNTPECNQSAEPFFLESYGDPDGINDIADHSWIQDEDGLWHLFFHWNGPNTNIAHFTTNDFRNITLVNATLLNDINKYYDAIWAPHVLKYEGRYYMFFTGVERPANPWTERIGLAVSDDLYNWGMYPVTGICQGVIGEGCVYECNNSWTAWNRGGPYDRQCRDPMVLRDEANNRWVMFTTARYMNIYSPTIDISYSDDLIDWTGAGYIKAAHRFWDGQGMQKTGGQAENPFVFEHGGKYYLFFTDWADPEPPAIVQYAVSDTLRFDNNGSLNWVYKGSIPDMGVNAIEILSMFDGSWLMSQSIAWETSGDYYTHKRDLRLKSLIWNPDGSFSISNLTSTNCRVLSANIHPGATDQCGDGVDQDCDGIDPVCISWGKTASSPVFVKPGMNSLVD